MVTWRHDFVVVFGVMQDHGAIPHGAVQYNHGAISHNTMQKESDCKKITDLVYFTLKFPKRLIVAIFTIYLNPEFFSTQQIFRPDLSGPRII
jgi:hypothetical protein